MIQILRQEDAFNLDIKDGKHTFILGHSIC